MSNKRNSSFLLFLKLSINMFLMMLIMNSIVIMIISLYKGRLIYSINFVPNINFLIAFSITWSLLNVRNYKETIVEIDNWELDEDQILARVKEFLIKAHWKIKKESEHELVFKSSLYHALWINRITATIENEKTVLIGPRLYIERVTRMLEI